MISDDGRHRRSVRLPGFDYAQQGASFVTICTFERECLFGDIVDGEMQLSPLGEIVRDEWVRTPAIRPEVEIDEFVVMPNHFHALVWFTGVGAHAVRPYGRPFAHRVHLGPWWPGSRQP